jgi:hypothetical protein
MEKVPKRDTTNGIHLYDDQFLVKQHAHLSAAPGYGKAITLYAMLWYMNVHYPAKDLTVILVKMPNVSVLDPVLPCPESFIVRDREDTNTSDIIHFLEGELDARRLILGRRGFYTDFRKQAGPYEDYPPRLLYVFDEIELEDSWFLRNQFECWACGVHCLFATENRKAFSPGLRPVCDLQLTLETKNVLSAKDKPINIV